MNNNHTLLSCPFCGGNYGIREFQEENDMKKVYSVEFMKYANYSKDTIDSIETDCIHTGGEPFLIFEDEIEKYKGYGEGIKSLTFVGNMMV